MGNQAPKALIFFGNSCFWGRLHYSSTLSGDKTIVKGLLVDIVMPTMDVVGHWCQLPDIAGSWFAPASS